MQSKISVITPINKIPPTFHLCVESLEKQTEQSFSWIFVINGRDLKKDRLVEFLPTNINYKILTLEGAIGPSASRNYGVKNSETEKILFLDADDYLNHDYIEKLLCLYNKYTTNHIFFGQGYKYRFVSNAVHRAQKTNLILKERNLTRPEIVLNEIGSITGVSVLKTNFLKFDEKLFFFEDYDFYVRSIIHDIEIIGCPELVYNYYVEKLSFSRYDLSKINFAASKLKERLKYFRFYEKILFRIQLKRLSGRHSNRILRTILLTLVLLILRPQYTFKLILRLLNV